VAPDDRYDPIGGEIKVYRMPATANRAQGLANGTWTKIYTVGPDNGFYIKHNPQFFRDQDGYLYAPSSAVVYSGQKGGPNEAGDISESQLYYSTFAP
jgi:hypothetical protein